MANKQEGSTDRITRLETYAKVTKGLGSFIVVLGLAICGWVGSYIASLNARLDREDVRLGDLEKSLVAIKQQLADGGNSRLVASLNHPSSLAQLSADLQMVGAQIAKARADHTPPNEQKLAAISGAVSQVVDSRPDAPRAWSTAVELVNYRYEANRQLLKPSLPNCRVVQGNDLSAYLFSIQTPATKGSTYLIEDCALDLDEVFWKEEVAKFFAAVNRVRPDLPKQILLRRVAVTYGGAQPLPNYTMRFEQCAFDLAVPEAIPSLDQKVLAKGLLTANVSDASIKLPTAES